MPQMELLQLRYFLETANHQSIARAAEKYMVPASSVSASIRRLEQELGAPLFHREHNRIELNEKGRILQASLLRVFEELDGAVERLTSAAADPREISILVRVMRSAVTDSIIDYKSKNPDIRFQTTFNFNEVAYEKYDIIISEQTDLFPGYQCLPLFETGLKLRVCADHPLAGKRLKLAQLSNQPFLSYSVTNNATHLLREACKEAGFSPKIALESNDTRCIHKALFAGMGIAISRERNGTKPPTGLVNLQVSDFNLTQTICCYYKEEAAYGNVRHFLNFITHRKTFG